jgi:AcrR family transcriptional regulator
VVFAARGLHAPLDEIARRAGVGNATLYRRFPTRGLLVAAVFSDALRELAAATDRAMATADPWTAFTDHLIYLCEVQAGNRALADLLTSLDVGDPELDTPRRKAVGGLVTLLHRARLAGAVRADFEDGDVLLILMANAGLTERVRGTDPAAWRRHLTYTLDGLSTPRATRPEPSSSSSTRT